MLHLSDVKNNLSIASHLLSQLTSSVPEDNNNAKKEPILIKIIFGDMFCSAHRIWSLEMAW